MRCTYSWRQAGAYVSICIGIIIGVGLIAADGAEAAQGNTYPDQNQYSSQRQFQNGMRRDFASLLPGQLQYEVVRSLDIGEVYTFKIDVARDISGIRRYPTLKRAQTRIGADIGITFECTGGLTCASSDPKRILVITGHPVEWIWTLRAPDRPGYCSMTFTVSQYDGNTSSVLAAHTFDETIAIRPTSHYEFSRWLNQIGNSIHSIATLALALVAAVGATTVVKSYRRLRRKAGSGGKRLRMSLKELKEKIRDQLVFSSSRRP